MKKAKSIAIIILSLTFSYCATKQKISEQKSENKFEAYIEYISNDSTFIKKIKSYYGDFSNCEKLHFNTDSYVRPIKLEEYPITILSGTNILNQLRDFKSLSEAEKRKKFNSVYDFTEYYSQNLSNKNWNNECGIKLTFAEKTNGILPLKFELIDKEIDSRINYQTRKGIYILKFNNVNKIVDSDYIILSN